MKLVDLIALPKEDPTELFKHRLLCRGGTMLLVGPTGSGKSTLENAWCVSWSLGKPCFGIVPTRPLRIVVVNAENDARDMREQVEGAVEALNLTADERTMVNERIVFVTEAKLTGATLCEMVRRVAIEHRADLIVLDPILAYLAGDANSQVDVGTFFRRQLKPVLDEVGAAALVVHHVAKPSLGRGNKSGQRADAYAGAGSAEFANFARSVISLEPTAVPDEFVLRLHKRGKRARWVDADGNRIMARYLRQSQVPGELRWTEISAAEHSACKPSVSQPSREPTVDEFVSIFPDDNSMSARDNLLSTVQIKDAVKRRGWEFSRYAHFRDRAVKEGRLATAIIARGAVLTGLKDQVARYHEEKR